MTVRRWRYEDIYAIAELGKECFPQEPWSFKQLASCFGGDNFYGFLADDGGEIAGYAGMTAVEDVADVENVAVAEQYRRSGVGAALVETLVQKAAELGVKRLYLEVRVSNAEAMRLYLKLGFKGLYARSRYYTDGEDCLVMVKEV